MPILETVVSPSEERDRRTAYALLRSAVGLSLLGHGLVRLPKLGVFHQWMMEQLAASIIPSELVFVVSFVVPFAELLLGLMVTFGVLTRVGLIGGLLLMIVLIFGSTTIENWSAIGDQLIHAGPLAALLAFSTFNTYSVDHLLLRRSEARVA